MGTAEVRSGNDEDMMPSVRGALRGQERSAASSATLQFYRPLQLHSEIPAALIPDWPPGGR